MKGTMADYIHRATKNHLQCRLNRHPFDQVGIYEYHWNGDHALYGVDLTCPRCALEAFDVVGEHGEKIGKRKYNYDATKRYKTERGETPPTRDELREVLIVFAKAKRKRTDSLPEWKQEVLHKAEAKV